MIVPLVQGQNRWSMNVETDEVGVGVVQVSHIRDSLGQRERIEVTVTLDDDTADVHFTVKAS